MKRKGNLFNKIINTNNLLLAHKNASKGKTHHKAVQKVEENLNYYIFELNKMLIDGSYEVSDYIISERKEHGKLREIHKLPYFPDRIIHHAILQIVQPILETTYIKDTYQSIKGRGIHRAKHRIRTFLKDKNHTTYCLKIDIKKYYASVDNNILKNMLRKKIKCIETLKLMDKIIDSTKGLPIGNYTSQTLGNFYLSYFDHWVKEVMSVKYFVRYADDMIFLHNDKKYLHKLLSSIKKYIKEELNLELKYNYQIFPSNMRGIDFLGFRFFHNYTLLRTSISTHIKKVSLRLEKRFVLKDMRILMSLYGWIKVSNGYNLLRHILSDKLKNKVNHFYSTIKLSNPLKTIVVVPKRVTSSRYYQPTLF